MRSREIPGLSLYDDGSFSLGGTMVPQGAEFPAVQLGEWTLSKALGEGTALHASRGDGRRIQFTYRDGAWATETNATPLRGPGSSRRAAKADDWANLETLKRLASLPQDHFYLSGLRTGPTSPPCVDGDVALCDDGTVVLGMESFLPGMPIDGYRFGGSIAYRRLASPVLVVASPGGIRWYYGYPMSHSKRNYLHDLIRKFKLLTEGRPTPFSALFKRKTEPRYRLFEVGASHLYVSESKHVYLGFFPRSEREEAPRFQARFPHLRWFNLFERDPDASPWGWRRLGPYVEIPPNEHVSFRSSSVNIEARPGVVLINEVLDLRPGGLIRGAYCMLREHDFSFAKWPTGREYPAPPPFDGGGWSWSKMFPRQGAVEFPRLGGIRPPKPLGR